MFRRKRKQEEAVAELGLMLSALASAIADEVVRKLNGKGMHRWTIKGMKACSKCGREKTLDQFNRDRRAKDGLRYVCRDCEALYRKKRTAEMRAREGLRGYWRRG